jgi:hypothetical protein
VTTSARICEYDVALSFAGEDRPYVSQVADSLKRRHVTVFYDEYERAELWGKDLFAHLSEVYLNRAKYTIMFISRHCAAKVWTNHERRSAQARALEEGGEYILPVRFDDTDVPGVLKTTGHIEAKNLLPSQVADLILKKLDIQSLGEIGHTVIHIVRNRVPWLWGFRGPPIPVPVPSEDETPVTVFIDDNELSSIRGGESTSFSLEPGIHYLRVESEVHDFVSGPQGSGGPVEIDAKSETIARRFAPDEAYRFEVTLKPTRFGPGCKLALKLCN